MGQNVRDVAINTSAYAITNHSTDRALDCNSTSDGELADVLGTLISDLVNAGILYGVVV